MDENADKKESYDRMDREMEDKEGLIFDAIEKLRHEVMYTRIAMGVLFAITILYIYLQTSMIGDALGTFIEMFLPE